MFFISYCFVNVAEKFLVGIEDQQNYSLLLLRLIDSQIDLQIRVAGAILFKNFIKNKWSLVRKKKNI